MHTGRVRLLSLIVCLGCLFLCSCGLDEYYVIYPPTCDHYVTVETSDPAEMYYRFRTATVTTLMSSQVMLRGTSVYYKLYPVSDETSMQEEMRIIEESNKEFSSNGFDKIKSTYKAVKFISGNNETEYLSPTGSDVEWKFFPLQDLSQDDGTGLLKVLTDNAGTYGSIEKPAATGEYYITAYAVTVGEVSLQPQYSQLAILGVLRITIN